MDKRGLELSVNTIIVAILVILVLVVVASFFLFGFKGLTDRVKATFFGVTAGTDVTLAVQNCQNYCDQVALLPTDTLKRNSAFCNTYFYIDEDGDGEADKKDDESYKKFYCWKKDSNQGNLDITCNIKVETATKGPREFCS